MMGRQLPSLLKSIVWQRDVINLTLHRHMYLAFCMLTSWQSSFVEIGLAVYGQWTLIEESLEIAALLYMEMVHVILKQFSLHNASVVPGADPSPSSEWLTVFLFLESPMNNSKITIKM